MWVACTHAGSGGNSTGWYQTRHTARNAWKRASTTRTRTAKHAPVPAILFLHTVTQRRPPAPLPSLENAKNTGNPPPPYLTRPYRVPLRLLCAYHVDPPLANRPLKNGENTTTPSPLLPSCLGSIPGASPYLLCIF